MKAETTIAIIEDDPAILLGLREKLTREGYRIVVAEDGERALEVLGREVPDLIVLDLMLPKIEGFEVCRWIRKRYPDVPVLILSARGQEEDKVRGLRTGADDYMTKPFGLKELLARIEALLRRTGDRGETRFGDVRVDLRAGVVRRGRDEVALSKTEWNLLKFLIRHRGRVVSREEIIDGAWGYDACPSPRVVDVHILSLRRKLERDPRAPVHILTVAGMGYRFAP